MNGFQNKRRPESQKQFPGCMGRMMNMFDLSAGMPGTKLLTDRAHRDGSPTHRNRSDSPKKLLDPVGVHTENKPITNESRQNSPSKRSGATPVKMLIAQEMSKETESKRRPPNVVAKLMGLDGLPVQQPSLTNQRNLYEDYSYEGSVQYSQMEEDIYFSSPLPCRTPSYVHEKEYKDVYEVWQQPCRLPCVKEQLQLRGRSNENSNENRMALVRQKFLEAKRLATDEKLFHSKEFQDALETIPQPSQTRRITVLKPSKAIEEGGMNQARIQQCPSGEERIWDKNKHRRCSSLENLKVENLSQPTRIVVLKPSPGKPCDFKALATNRISSPKSLDERDLSRNIKADEAIGSRDIAKEITRQMRESMNSNRRDDSLLSSVLSNGYVGDESSFNRSENYVEEAGGNLSDSEIVTPTSRHSWDYMNRYGSPYSFSSISRASYSPESSVIREAKKRLSALVASNGIGQEQTHVRRSSSTLGEMLAISEVKKEENVKELDFTSNGSCGGGDLKASTPCLSIGIASDAANGERSPMGLSRSKSVPVSSSTYENIELNAEVSDTPKSKLDTRTEEGKTKNGKLSFKGKVSSLFFSRNKKSSREKSIPSSLVASDARLHPRHADIAVRDDISKPTVERSLSPADNPSKAAVSLEKPSISESPSENQEQPSPVSVLEAKFEDDSNSNVPQCTESFPVGHLQALSRSPPIESLARSLSWDDSCMDASTINNPSKLPTRASFKADEEEEECIDFVLKLLSSTGLDNKNSKTIFSRWHSMDSPLDQMLLAGFLDEKDEEAKCKGRQLTQRLLFDSVNAALLDIGRTAFLNACPQARSYIGTLKDFPSDTSVTDEVLSIINTWFSGDRKWLTGEAGNSAVIVDGVVRKEAVGREWTELMWWELDEISKEIGGKVLEQLVGEALSDLTDGCL
ncbi:uncharacterized protein LOC120276408 isoform X2 [Dioscorea cayenensis subsp. rotundata]|uniref:Uncharacterized protein LOC120276408 isoform X2 n=1 Tax=Dioscorea cayennensis subsp. rotundata TaxID=55577 RepID=A0AB40CHR7_DIOCR|nr:uncharacterized protein LOC120276408 isoform X2 [Dioscorea cayenensis subsp. rotundata]